MNFPKILILTSCIVLSAPNLFAAQTKAATHGSTTAADQKAIASAMSAAPKKVAAAATIVAMGKDGKMHTLRKGHNNFTCMPDNPATPGPDPGAGQRGADCAGLQRHLARGDDGLARRCAGLRAGLCADRRHHRQRSRLLWHRIPSRGSRCCGLAGRHGRH